MTFFKVYNTENVHRVIGCPQNQISSRDKVLALWEPRYVVLDSINQNNGYWKKYLNIWRKTA